MELSYLIWLPAMLTAGIFVKGTLGCVDPGTPENGSRDPSESLTHAVLSERTVLHFSCNEGYHLVGPPKVICSEGRLLPDHIPSCFANEPCISNPCQNEATCVGVTEGYRCHCSTQYHGEHCELRMDCELPSDTEVPNSHYTVHGQESDSPGWYQPGTYVVYQCDPGFVIQGGDNRMCQSGQWSSQTPQCVANACPHPGVIEHGTVSGAFPAAIGSWVQYKCDIGYLLQGAKQRECQVGGVWSGLPPVCSIHDAELCQDPGTPDNADRCCQNVFFAGVRLSFYCHDGYQLIGSDERICLQDGTWSGLQPTCQRVTTPPSPADTNMFNTETLTIVTATTGSILGILVVTVILTSRQCRGHRHLGRPYHPVLRARLARLHRDPDTTVLLAVADNIDVVLPSYDEAVATNVAQPPPFEATSSEVNEDHEPGSENRSVAMQGRPLPAVPPTNQSPSSGHPRNRRNSSNQSSQPPPQPPPVNQDGNVEETVVSPGPSDGEGQESEVSHTNVGNDLYAEVTHRRGDE